MNIYLIRHGQTTGDLEDRYGGDYDDHLSEEGIQQVRSLTNKLSQKSLACLYHSPKRRAQETAKIVAEQLAIPCQEIQDIRERNAYGIVTGMIKSEAKERFPEEIARLQADKLYHTVTGSESYELFRTRVIAACMQIITQASTAGFENIAIITHGGVISCLLRELLNTEALQLGDCCLIALDYTDAVGFSLVSLDNAQVVK